jgi:hypothetical protein
MTKQIDLSHASVNEIMVLAEMLIDVLVKHADVDLEGTVINITVNKDGEDPRVVAHVTGEAIVNRLAGLIDETA